MLSGLLCQASFGPVLFSSLSASPDDPHVFVSAHKQSWTETREIPLYYVCGCMLLGTQFTHRTFRRTCAIPHMVRSVFSGDYGQLVGLRALLSPEYFNHTRGNDSQLHNWQAMKFKVTREIDCFFLQVVRSACSTFPPP